MAVQSTSLNGTFNGFTTQQGRVEIFKNIKFAAFPERWTHSTLYEDFKGATVDCTKNGTRCPQAIPADGDDYYFAIPEDQCRQQPLEDDEFECLNLMISRPAGDYSKLPVVVWIHGGSNILGSAYQEVYNPSSLIDHSIKLGKPIIIVHLQYRLGAFGWLSINGRSNFGRHDQYLGLEWVNRHIADFGGDPSNVTLFGQSAGSVAVYYLAFHPNSANLIKRIALLSGASGTIEMVSEARQDHILKRFLRGSGCRDINELKQLSFKKLVKTQFKVGYGVGNHTFDISHNIEPDFAHGSVPKGLEGVLISDTANEGELISLATGGKEVGDLYSTLNKTVLGREIIKEYGVSRNDTIHTKIMDIFGDYAFGEPSDLLSKNIVSQSPTTKVFRLFFDQYNPFEPSKRAHHSVDMLYLFGAYQLPEADQALSKDLQRRYIAFFNGQDPWNGKQARWYHDGDVTQLDPISWSKARRIYQFEFLRRYTRAQLSKVINPLLRP